jgi:hypothetical protein
MFKRYTFKATAISMSVVIVVTLGSHGHVCQENGCSAWSDQPDGPSNRRTVQLYGPPVVVASSVIPRS